MTPLEFNPKAVLANLLTQDEHMLFQKKKAMILSGYTGSVLITGQSGTGKELLAKGIHAGKLGKFIPVNCGGYPEHLADSILFGHKRGSFTDARADAPGQFSAAYDGTIFFDEIATMPMSLQIKLLRVLEDGTYFAVGDATPQRSNARVVAATNEDLILMVSEGRFRRDLYERISTYTLTTTPLSSRPGDIDLFLAAYHKDFYNDKEAMENLKRVALPGNYRSLRNHVLNAELNKKVKSYE